MLFKLPVCISLTPTVVPPNIRDSVTLNMTIIILTIVHSPISIHLGYSYCSFAVRNTTAISTMSRPLGAPRWRNVIGFLPLLLLSP